MTSISRRTLIGGLAAIPAAACPGRALCAPEAPDIGIDLPHALAGPPAAETPLEKIDRLTAELAVALDEWAQGRNAWHVVVPRASTGQPYYFMNGAPSYRRDGRGA